MPNENRRKAPRRPTRLRHKLMLAALSGVGTLALLEGSLWCFHPLDRVPPKRFHKYLPSWSAVAPTPRTLKFDPGPLAGVTPGVSLLEFNRFGFLYPDTEFERASPDEVRIAVVGGSTAECSALAADKRWSAVLESLVQKYLPDRPVTVLNLGASAQDTRTHLATMSQHITDLDVNLVIFMLGANDLYRVGGHQPMTTSDCFYRTTSVSRCLKFLFRLTQIGRHIHNRPRFSSGSPKPYFHEQVLLQASLPMIEEPVRISTAALAGYARSITSLYGLCHAHGIAAIFTTQPTMLTANPTEEERAVLWGFHTGNRNVTPANLIAVLSSLNQCLLDTCEKGGYEYTDLAKKIPTGLECFYDPMHFNERGAQLVAENLAPRALEVLGVSR